MNHSSGLAGIDGTRWSGSAELWLDPLGDAVQRSDATMSVAGQVLRYTWRYEGEPQRGSVALEEQGAQFTDSWHQPDPMPCRSVPGARGLFCVEGSYGPAGEWGWRIGLSRRDGSGELVLQMTNIAPWGEEVRAVRMICVPAAQE